MSGKRQKSQLQMAFRFDGTGEACFDMAEGTGTLAAEREPENPANGQQLMEEICEWENLSKALKRVQTNEGSPGIDGMTVDELPGYLKEHWPAIREHVLNDAWTLHLAHHASFPWRDGVLLIAIGIATGTIKRGDSFGAVVFQAREI